MTKKRTSKARRASDASRRQGIYEKAKDFEERVAELFRFLGYTTTLDYQRDSLQFDVRLDMSDGPLPIHALVECKDTGKPIGQREIREFASKVEHAKKADVLPYQAILVSRSGFINNAHEVARHHFVYLRTFEQLILSLVNFGPNLEATVQAFRGTPLEHLYVEQDVILQSGKEGSYPEPPVGLTKAVLAWINQPKKSFLTVLGDFGAGKTSFCKRLACELAIRVREQPGSARIPVVIDLRSGGSTTVTLENLLTHHFQSLSSQPLSLPSLLYLNRKGYLVLLFDGFDEVIAYSEPSRYLENLRQILRAAEGEAKVILTCRTHYFRDRPEEIRYLSNTSEVLVTEGATRLYDELSKRPGVDIAYVRELTEEQIDEYLSKAVQPPADWKAFREQIWSTYNLRNLAERPFLLEIIVKTLPKLQQNADRSRVTVADLYATYCESWFKHTDFRLTLTRERRVALVEHLAKKLWNEPEQRVHYQSLFEECTSFFTGQKLTPSEKEKIDFEVRTALFLRRDAEGHYSFAHRSFLEFFIARALYSGILAGNYYCLDIRRVTREVVFFLTLWDEAGQIPLVAGSILTGDYQPRISENALQMLAFYARSKVSPLVGSGTEARDSVDSLHRIRGHFRALRPSAIHLDGAALEGADLRGIDLEGACLTGVRLDRAQLQGASFARARLTGASLAFANAWKANFTEATLVNAHIEHAQCREGSFQNADLTGADLSFASVDSSLTKPSDPFDIEVNEESQLELLSLRDNVGSPSLRLARQATFLLVDSRAEMVVHRDARPPAITEVARDHPLPSSLKQRRIWFLSNLDPSLPLLLVLTLNLKGQLSIVALRKSIQELMRRHEILRTTFQELGGDVIQEILPEAAAPLPLVDLRGTHRGEQERIVCSLTYEVQNRPLDIACGPLFTAIILALASDEHVVLLTMHQMICDERSRDLLAQELGDLYGAFSRDASSPLSEPVLHFADFAAWQRHRQEEINKVDLPYWRERLAGAPISLNLTTDRSRPAALPSTNGASQSLHIAEDMAGALQALSRDRKVTPLISILSIFNILLGRYARCEDIVLGLFVHGRNYAVFESMVGPFEDVRVLRTDLSGGLTFEEVLEKSRETTLAALASELPFDQLVEDLRPPRSLTHAPIFQVALSFHNSIRVNGFSPLTATVLDQEDRSSYYDLSLAVTATEESLLADMNYHMDLFDATTIRRMLLHMESILKHVAATPTARLEDLTLMSPGEIQQLIAEWNDTVYSFTQSELRLHDLFEAQVRHTPEAQAIVLESQSLTYAGLDHIATEWSNHLRILGVGPETRVALLMDRSIEMVAGLLAVLKAGGAYVPLDPAYPRERLQFVLEDSSASVLLTQRRFAELVLQPGLPVLCVDELRPSAKPDLRSIATRSATPDNLCYIIYTSGSTGRPKGAMITHRGVVNLLLGTQHTHQLVPEDRVLQQFSLAFDFSVQQIFWPLITGACLVLAQHDWPSTTNHLIRTISEQRITTLSTVPSALRLLLQDSGIESGCTYLRRVLVGGETIASETQQRFFERLTQGTELHNTYGPTEGTVNVTSCRLTRLASSAATGTLIGAPVANTRIHLLDWQLRPVPIGVPGQLCIGGPQLARGYYSNPRLTAERFFPDPFSAKTGERLYATGDLARYNAYGSIEFLGRVDLQVKVRGFRIELGEIEAAIHQHSEVKGAVVVVREDSPGDRRLVAYVVKAEGNLTPAGLRDFLKERLPEVMVPSSFVFLAALPLTPSGRVDRRALPAPAGEDLTYVGPRDFVERTLVEIWSEILHIEKVGIYDNFFELGGHSLGIVQMIYKIKERLDLHLPAMEAFKIPILGELASSLRKMRHQE